jgi:membrane-anchored glycerophosphoryl diester phosphodiesterase (GDPDase)
MVNVSRRFTGLALACVERIKTMPKPILIVLFAIIALAVLGFAYLQFGWVFYRYHSAACKERGKAYAARVEKLKREAYERLRIGTQRMT